MPNTAHGLPYPDGSGKLGLIWQYIKDLADAIDAALWGPAWTNLTLAGTWVAYDAVPGTMFHIPGYKKIGSRIHLRGVVKSGAAGAITAALPAGSRPLKAANFICSSATGLALVQVTSGGVVSLSAYATGGANTSVSLDGISFDTI